MTQTKTTTKQNGKARLSIVGFVELTDINSVIARVPGATYLLSNRMWGALIRSRQVYGTEINRLELEDQMQANSVQWFVRNGAVIIDDLAEGRKFCVREDDLMSISPGQQIPVYGRDNPAWKYLTPVIAEMEKALPAVV